jgi:hypothetical protein
VSSSDVNNDLYINFHDDNDIDHGRTKNDDLRNLEQFLGNTGHTFTSDDPTSIFEVMTRFLENDFLEILLEQSNLYHAQNADK